MEDEKQYDIDGYDVITNALRELINKYPALNGDEITYSSLEEDKGKAMFPVSGGVIESKKEDITGHVTQVCLYPFYVVYRGSGLSENRKVNAKEWLDNLGKWLERQPITVNGTDYRLSEYPPLTGKRKFLSIERKTPGYLDSVNDNNSENWAIYLSARYQNEYDL